MPSATDVLDVEHLTVCLGDAVILRDLTFSVTARSIVAVIGPNGSGKTMLFRALIGAIAYDGIVRWRRGVRFGYVPQKLDLDRTLPVTGRDLLGARARLAGLGSRDIATAMSRVSLADEVGAQLIGTLSGGQFQRLLMAFALLAKPTVLLLDEPTAGVDEPGQERVNDTVLRLRSEGVTILMISHDLSVVSRIATSVLCITHRHQCYGAPRELLTPQLLAEVYGEPVSLFVHDVADH